MTIEERAIQISRVYKTAENKPDCFHAFIKSNPSSVSNCIIFCAEHEQGDQIGEKLNDINKKFTRIYDENANQKDALDRLANKEIDAIVACISFSQGIDIKSLDKIFLVASKTGSSDEGHRETIQRIGRCIRLDKENNPEKVAKVFDLVLKKDDEDIQAENNRKVWLTNISI